MNKDEHLLLNRVEGTCQIGKLKEGVSVESCTNLEDYYDIREPRQFEMAKIQGADVMLIDSYPTLGFTEAIAGIDHYYN